MKNKIWSLKRSKRISVLTLLLLALLTSYAIGNAAADPRNDPLGEEIPEDETLGPATTEDFGTLPPLPFTEKDQRTRAALVERYPSWENLNLRIASIDPDAGPTTGATRVLVRGGPFENMNLLYPTPKCKFGRNDRVVDAAYVRCTEEPLTVDQSEGNRLNRTAWCLQCDDAPKSEVDEKVPFMISLLGNFSDAPDATEFQYYKPVVVKAIYPHYGPKDGGTVIQVWGENFLNRAENTRCNFGPKSVVAHWKTDKYMICIAPFSDTVAKPITFSVGLNKQQNSRQLISYWYYNNPTIAKLEPNFGPESGGQTTDVVGGGLFPFADYLPGNKFRSSSDPNEFRRMLIENDPFSVDNANDTFCRYNFFNQKDNSFTNKYVKAEPISAEKMKCEVPATWDDIPSAIVDVTLNNQNFTDDEVPYYYYKSPKIIDAIPSEGPTDGGTSVKMFAPETHPFNLHKHLIANWFQKPVVPLNDTTKICNQTWEEVKPQMQDMCNVTHGERLAPCYKKMNSTEKQIAKELVKAQCEQNDTLAPLIPKNVTVIKKVTNRCRPDPESITQVICLSPKSPVPGPINVTLMYQEDGVRSESNPIIFTYFDAPQLIDIQPKCGPTYGQTQLTVIGSSFTESGFGRAKCVFNNTRYTNATIVNSEKLYCSTPKLTDFEASLPWQDMKYVVKVTMNGQHLTDGHSEFAYYHDPEIIATRDSNIGPVSGGTLSILQGRGFANPNVCNLKVRYGALEVTPTQVFNNTMIQTESPEVSVPDAVVLSASGNGQQYAKDWVYHHRDIENTFTYIQDVLVHTLRPQAGPTTGRTRIEISGIGFEQIRSEAGPLRKDIPLYVKFTDLNGKDIGNVTKITEMDNDIIIWHTPNATEGTKAILYMSYNQQNWQAIIPTEKTFSYLYYDAPVVTAINPKVGPVKNPTGEKAIISGRNFVCPDGDCSKVQVRFGDPEFGTVVPGTVLSPTQIQCQIPPYPKPDIMYVDVTMNGNDYTNDHVTYGYFDAFVIDVNPKLIPIQGGTNLTMTGFGFVDSEQGIKSKFGSKEKGEFGCNTGTPCIKEAKFIDKNTVMAVSEPQEVMNYASGNHTNIGQDPFTVEASVFGSQFTENQIEVYYIYEPDFESINRNSVPRNLQVPIIAKTNFHWDKNSYEMFLFNANWTCRYTIGDDNPEVVITQGRMETMPLGSQYLEGDDKPLPSHVICPSPKWIKPGKGVLEISVNGVDYLGNFFPFESTDPADLDRVVPLSGPKHTSSTMKVIGTGMKKSGDPLAIRTGNFALEPVKKDQIVEYIWSQSEYLASMLMTPADLRQFRIVERTLHDGETLDSLMITAQKAAINLLELNVNNATHGGPVFMGLGEGIDLDMLEVTQEQASQLLVHDTVRVVTEEEEKKGGDAANAADGGRLLSVAGDEARAAGKKSGSVDRPTKKAHRYFFTDDPVEKYYYHQPVVKKVQPTSGLTTGGTPIEVSGAWFDQRLEYGVIPYCKIGDKIVRAQFFSTVRIVCMSPPNDNLNACLPILVSLNGVDWVNTETCFGYYTNPEITNMFPKSGPYQGGTELLITGTKFSNITDPDNVKCKYTLLNSTRRALPKYMPAIYRNATTMMCISPNGFLGGEKIQVQLTFNGQDYSSPMPELVFHYYTIFGPFPRSGPADDCLDRNIAVRGAGFNSSTQVVCQINNTDIAPRSISENYIMCPMCLPNKDPNVIGAVKFGITFDGSWTDFGDFYYYKQISIDSSWPPIGPNEGEGQIYFSGNNFRDDFPGVQLGCRVGGSDGAIGKGVITSDGNIRCVVEQMRLVNENEGLPLELSLNSDSWVTRKDPPLMYKPYGIVEIAPASGPYSGFTDVMITGKGFLDEFKDGARCRFGIDNHYVIVEAEVLDYGKMVCRSPQNFPLPQTSDMPILSVPFGIAFGEEKFSPWTIGLHRYRFYSAPRIELAIPDEVRIGKFAEVYLKAYDDKQFFEPLPTRRGSDATAMLCQWEQFGTSMGMYVNETFAMCVTPHINGRPEDYYRETVNVIVGMNGQDFADVESDAYVTFIGTGSDKGILIFLGAILLLALLILACLALCMVMMSNNSQQARQPKLLLPQVKQVPTRVGDGTVPRGTGQGGRPSGPSP